MFEFLQPPGWAKPSGYANGIAARGKMVFVAGQIGWNEQCKFESDDLVEQTGQHPEKRRSRLARRRRRA